MFRAENINIQIFNIQIALGYPGIRSLTESHSQQISEYILRKIVGNKVIEFSKFVTKIRILYTYMSKGYESGADLNAANATKIDIQSIQMALSVRLFDACSRFAEKGGGD